MVSSALSPVNGIGIFYDFANGVSRKSMSTLTYQGTIGIPMFDTGVDMTPVNNGLWGNLAFDRFSYAPVVGSDLENGGINGGPTTAGGMVMPAVAGQGYVHLFNTNPASGFPNHGHWFDNNVFWVNGAKNTGSSGTFYNQSLGQPYVPGDYNLPSYFNASPVTYPNTPNQFNIGPGYLANGEKVATLIYNESDLATRIAINVYTTGLTLLEDGFKLPDPYGRIATDVEYIPNRGTKLGDNSLFIAGGVTNLNKITYFTTNGLTLDQSNEYVNIDNATFDNYWQANSFGSVAIWYGGYIITIPTPGGTGPSAQNNEYLVTNPEMTTYYLMKFLPQDEYSTQVLATDANWTVNIDVNGIVWLGPNAFASGQQGKAIYSYSRDYIGVPIINNPQIPPIVLPCWNNCQPSVLMT